jgi:hypothetical protein
MFFAVLIIGGPENRVKQQIRRVILQFQGYNTSLKDNPCKEANLYSNPKENKIPVTLTTSKQSNFW